MTRLLDRRRAMRAALCCAALVPAVLIAGQPRIPVPFVPPARTEKVADGMRTATLDASSYGRKFAVENTRPKVTISNPFMDPQRPFFARAESIRCAADGRVVVSGRAGFDKDARAVAAGFWQIAPDGAVTPLAARDNNKVGGPACGTAFAQSGVPATRFSIGADGRLIFAGEGSIQAVTGDAQVVRVAGAVGSCTGQPRTKGFLDGDADGARFSETGRPVEDTDGNVWVPDQDGCALRKIDRNGHVTTVLGKDALCDDAKPPEDQPLLQELAWDAVHNELVVAGSRTVARPVHDLYTLVFRIAPDGTTKRVLFGKKVTRVSPSKHHLDGVRAMTVDAKGAILIVSQLMIFEQRGFDVLQLMKLDEPNATVVMLSGTKIPKGTWLAEYPYDGPLDRAYFEGTRDMCAAPDGTIYVNDDILIRKIDPKGVVTTWAF
ncbi:MAG: hypothetical protein U0P30_13690 [Vicinamibacterales bacterium]